MREIPKGMEKKLMRIKALLEGYVTDAKRSVELHQPFAGRELPGDPILLQAVTRLTQMESINRELESAFPFLNHKREIKIRKVTTQHLS